jgi:hypothetical protein
MPCSMMLLASGRYTVMSRHVRCNICKHHATPAAYFANYLRRIGRAFAWHHRLISVAYGSTSVMALLVTWYYDCRWYTSITSPVQCYTMMYKHCTSTALSSTQCQAVPATTMAGSAIQWIAVGQAGPYIESMYLQICLQLSVLNITCANCACSS